MKCKRGDIKQRRDTAVVPPFLRGRWKKKEKRRKEKKRKEQNKIKPKGEKGNAGTKSIVKKIRARIFPLFPLFYVYTDRYRCPLEISLRFTFHFFFDNNNNRKNRWERKKKWTKDTFLFSHRHPKQNLISLFETFSNFLLWIEILDNQIYPSLSNVPNLLLYDIKILYKQTDNQIYPPSQFSLLFVKINTTLFTQETDSIRKKFTKKKNERKSYKILETLLSLSLSLSHSNSSRASPSLPSFRSFERIEKSARVPVKVGRNGDTRGEIKPPSPVSRVPRCNLPSKSLLGRNTGKYRKCPGDTLGRGTFDS